MKLYEIQMTPSNIYSFSSCASRHFVSYQNIFIIRSDLKYGLYWHLSQRWQEVRFEIWFMETGQAGAAKTRTQPTQPVLQSVETLGFCGHRRNVLINIFQIALLKPPVIRKMTRKMFQGSSLYIFYFSNLVRFFSI